ncbi:hypothetical protein Q8791_29040 [Nocardiopsis sp. CT-R113]|uniref:Head-to-tail adaptor n=1 Tax=Nocardiopsis codii TaxID=3065942 RepID=A0ABU7KGE1_9ACTN|nr:hypothetical protein [Nocardiopsis sp. CT-R113]MEE2041278.1 hypothetical protein [Nocardiopsis sp. CT-R113]
MRRYATVEDLGAFLGPAAVVPEDAEQLLDQASEVVDELLLSARYAVDAAGMPTDPDVAEALARATCAQAVYIDDSGDRTGAGSQWSSASLGGASYVRATGGPGPMGHAPRAVRILRTAGLCRGVRVRG